MNGSNYDWSHFLFVFDGIPLRNPRADETGGVELSGSLRCEGTPKYFSTLGLR
jgi:hypothetical protein